MWQHLHSGTGAGARVVAVAVDAQGPEVVQPWLDRAGAGFPCLVDARGAVPAALGTSVVRTFVALDPRGRAVRPPVKVHAAEPETSTAVREWLATGDPGALDVLSAGGAPAGSGADAAALAASRAWLELAAVALRDGRRQDATAALRRALDADPGNALVRRQLWALTDPERFYDGEVDKDWQRRQLGGA